MIGVRQTLQDAGDSLLAARALEEPLDVAKPLRQAPARIGNRHRKQGKPPRYISKHRRSQCEPSDEHAEEQGPEPRHHALYARPLAGDTVNFSHF